MVMMNKRIRRLIRRFSIWLAVQWVPARPTKERWEQRFDRLLKGVGLA